MTQQPIHVHMRDQKANQTAMLIRVGKQKTLASIEEFLLLLAFWGLGLLVAIS